MLPQFLSECPSTKAGCSQDVRNLHKTLARMNFSNLIGPWAILKLRKIAGLKIVALWYCIVMENEWRCWNQMKTWWFFRSYWLGWISLSSCRYQTAPHVAAKSASGLTAGRWGLVTHQSPSRAKQTPESAERLADALERRGHVVTWTWMSMDVHYIKLRCLKSQNMCSF